MNKNWLNFLGLALRASTVITGEQIVVQAIQKQSVHLVILAEDTGSNTLKKVTDKCKTYHVTCIQTGQSDELGHALGKDFRKVIGITDANMAKALLSKLTD